MSTWPPMPLGSDTAMFWMPDPKDYAVQQLRMQHDQTLYSLGEYAMFVLMWRADDFEAGRVARCNRCFTAYGDIAKAYGQGARADCPECYGSSFEGGFKAKLVRPSLWTFTEPEHREQPHGEDTIESAVVQTTGDFRMKVGDYILRSDGSRWRMAAPSADHVRTGFQTPGMVDAIGFNYGRVNRQDESAPAYLIPPSAATLTAALDVTGLRYPLDFSALEYLAPGAVLS